MVRRFIPPSDPALNPNLGTMTPRVQRKSRRKTKDAVAYHPNQRNTWGARETRAMSGDFPGAKEDGGSPTHSSENDVRDRVRTEGQLGRVVAATRTNKEGEHETGRAARDVDGSAAGEVEVAELGECPAAVGPETRVSILCTGGGVYMKECVLGAPDPVSDRRVCASVKVSRLT